MLHACEMTRWALADIDRRYADSAADEVHFGYLALEARCAALEIAAIGQRSLKGLSKIANRPMIG
jgi:hypothetical protein